MQSPNLLNYLEQDRLNTEQESDEVQSNAIFNTIYESVISSVLIVLLVLSNGAY